MTYWQRLGRYEYEYDQRCEYTGWHRCAYGQMADGRHPEWNYLTGEERFS